MSLSGSCLCGAVKYETTGDPMAMAVCHCRNCQKQSGAPFSANVVFLKDQVAFEGELATYEDQGDNGNKVQRRFCGKCGSPIVSELSSGLLAMKAGTVDDTSSLTPAVQLWCDSKQDWLELAGDIMAFPGDMPS